MPSDRHPHDHQPDRGGPHDALVDLLQRQPAPSMHVDLAEVVAQGRRRTRRRAAGVAVAACAAAVAALAVGSTLLSPGNDTTTPAGTTSSSPGGAGRATDQPTDRGPSDPGLSGRHALTVGDARYTMSVGNGLLTIDVVRGGHRERDVAGLLGSGGAWRVIDGTEGRQVVTGIVPGVAGAIELRPVLGHTVPEHSVSLAPGRDFTAFVVTFAEPLDELTPAADIGWSASGPATSWILGSEPQMASFGVTMAGEGETPLPPSDFTRTGPATRGAPASVVISITLPDARIGGSAIATLQGDLVVKDPSRLSVLLLGRDPETSLARGSFQLTDGRTFVWGVAPAGTTDVVPQVAAGAKAGRVVLAPMMGAWTAYAVEVEGSATPPTGLDVTLGDGRDGFSVIE